MRLRVATLNTWALPWGLAQHVPERMQAIGAGLEALDVDVAAFQEVWTPEARQVLLEHGQRAGLVHTWYNRGGLGASGMLVMSRLPITEKRFRFYGLRGLPQRIWHGDYWAGKGFALLGLATPAGPVALVCTHLHSQYAPDAQDDYLAHRTAQVVQLAEALRGVVTPLVAVGDFNLRDDQPLHGVLAGLGGLRDAAAELGRPQPTALASNPFRRERTASDSRIDYVWLRDGTGARVRPLSVERAFDAPLELDGVPLAPSDHVGLRAELEIRSGSGRRPEPSAEAVAAARSVLEQGRVQARQRQRGQRVGAAALLGGGGLALAGGTRGPLARRRLLRTLVLGAGALALPAGLGLGALSEWFGRAERDAFEETLARLDALAPSAALPGQGASG